MPAPQVEGRIEKDKPSGGMTRQEHELFLQMVDELEDGGITEDSGIAFLDYVEQTNNVGRLRSLAMALAHNLDDIEKTNPNAARLVNSMIGVCRHKITNIKTEGENRLKYLGDKYVKNPVIGILGLMGIPTERVGEYLWVRSEINNPNSPLFMDKDMAQKAAKMARTGGIDKPWYSFLQGHDENSKKLGIGDTTASAMMILREKAFPVISSTPLGSKYAKALSNEINKIFYNGEQKYSWDKLGEEEMNLLYDHVFAYQWSMGSVEPGAARDEDFKNRFGHHEEFNPKDRHEGQSGTLAAIRMASAKKLGGARLYDGEKSSQLWDYFNDLRDLAIKNETKNNPQILNSIIDQVRSESGMLTMVGHLVHDPLVWFSPVKDAVGLLAKSSTAGYAKFAVDTLRTSVSTSVLRRIAISKRASMLKRIEDLSSKIKGGLIDEAAEVAMREAAQQLFTDVIGPARKALKGDMSPENMQKLGINVEEFNAANELYNATMKMVTMESSDPAARMIFAANREGSPVIDAIAAKREIRELSKKADNLKRAIEGDGVTLNQLRADTAGTVAQDPLVEFTYSFRKQRGELEFSDEFVKESQKFVDIALEETYPALKNMPEASKAVQLRKIKELYNTIGREMNKHKLGAESKYPIEALAAMRGTLHRMSSAGKVPPTTLDNLLNAAKKESKSLGKDIPFEPRPVDMPKAKKVFTTQEGLAEMKSKFDEAVFNRDSAIRKKVEIQEQLDKARKIHSDNIKNNAAYSKEEILEAKEGINSLSDELKRESAAVDIHTREAESLKRSLDVAEVHQEGTPMGRLGAASARFFSNANTKETIVAASELGQKFLTQVKRGEAEYSAAVGDYSKRLHNIIPATTKGRERFFDLVDGNNQFSRLYNAITGSKPRFSKDGKVVEILLDEARDPEKFNSLASMIASAGAENSNEIQNLLTGIKRKLGVSDDEILGAMRYRTMSEKSFNKLGRDYSPNHVTNYMRRFSEEDKNIPVLKMRRSQQHAGTAFVRGVGDSRDAARKAFVHGKRRDIINRMSGGFAKSSGEEFLSMAGDTARASVKELKSKLGAVSDPLAKSVIEKQIAAYNSFFTEGSIVKNPTMIGNAARRMLGWYDSLLSTLKAGHTTLQVPRFYILQDFEHAFKRVWSRNPGEVKPLSLGQEAKAAGGFVRDTFWDTGPLGWLKEGIQMKKGGNSIPVRSMKDGRDISRQIVGAAAVDDGANPLIKSTFADEMNAIGNWPLLGTLQKFSRRYDVRIRTVGGRAAYQRSFQYYKATGKSDEVAETLAINDAQNWIRNNLYNYNEASGWVKAGKRGIPYLIFQTKELGWVFNATANNSAKIRFLQHGFEFDKSHETEEDLGRQLAMGEITPEQYLKSRKRSEIEYGQVFWRPSVAGEPLKIFGKDVALYPFKHVPGSNSMIGQDVWKPEDDGGFRLSQYTNAFAPFTFYPTPFVDPVVDGVNSVVRGLARMAGEDPSKYENDIPSFAEHVDRLLGQNPVMKAIMDTLDPEMGWMTFPGDTMTDEEIKQLPHSKRIARSEQKAGIAALRKMYKEAGDNPSVQQVEDWFYKSFPKIKKDAWKDRMLGVFAKFFTAGIVQFRDENYDVASKIFDEYFPPEYQSVEPDDEAIEFYKSQGMNDHTARAVAKIELTLAIGDEETREKRREIVDANPWIKHSFKFRLSEGEVASSFNMDKVIERVAQSKQDALNALDEKEAAVAWSKANVYASDPVYRAYQQAVGGPINYEKVHEYFESDNPRENFKKFIRGEPVNLDLQMVNPQYHESLEAVTNGEDDPNINTFKEHATTEPTGEISMGTAPTRGEVEMYQGSKLNGGAEVTSGTNVNDTAGTSGVPKFDWNEPDDKGRGTQGLPAVEGNAGEPTGGIEPGGTVGQPTTPVPQLGNGNQ